MNAKITAAMESIVSYIENNYDYQFIYTELKGVLDGLKLDDKTVVENLMLGMKIELLLHLKIQNQLLLDFETCNIVF